MLYSYIKMGFSKQFFGDQNFKQSQKMIILWIKYASHLWFLQCGVQEFAKLRASRTFTPYVPYAP